LLSLVWLVILMFCRLKIDIHAAFWQLSVPKIVTLGCGFMHDASLLITQNLAKAPNEKEFWQGVQ